MVERLKNFFDQKSIETHFLISLVLGLIFRLLTSFFVWGPQALDDYKHGVVPAYQWAFGLPVELPDYRSPLLVWILGGVLKLGSVVGVSSALSQARLITLFMGLCFILGLLGVYLLVKRETSRRVQALALYLFSLFGIMPFVSTRAFGEVLAMNFVALGFGLLWFAKAFERTTKYDFRERSFAMVFFGFLFLGIATLFRFQVGLLFLSSLAILLVLKQTRVLLIAVFAGLATLALQIGIDFIAQKGFLGTLFAYLKANEGGGAKYGVMPWYNTWLLVLGLTLFPFSLVFAKRFKDLLRHWFPIFLPFLLFVLIHSLVAHKEERFMYPILPLLWVFLAYVWGETWDEGPVRKFYTPLFVTLSTIILLALSFNNSQGGEVEPMAHIQKSYDRAILIDKNSLLSQSRIQNFFIRPPSFVITAPMINFDFRVVQETLSQYPQHQAVALLTSDEQDRHQVEALANHSQEGLSCGKLHVSQSPIDKLLYTLNPKHNKRRRPTWFVVCNRS